METEQDKRTTSSDNASEFTTINPHWAKSSHGFEVKLLGYCDIHYIDAKGTVEFDSEWLEGNAICLYPDSHDTVGLKGRSPESRSAVLTNVTKGFNHLGFGVEIDDIEVTEA